MNDAQKYADLAVWHANRAKSLSRLAMVLGVLAVALSLTSAIITVAAA